MFFSSLYAGTTIDSSIIVSLPQLKFPGCSSRDVVLGDQRSWLSCNGTGHSWFERGRNRYLKIRSTCVPPTFSHSCTSATTSTTLLFGRQPNWLAARIESVM